MTQGKPTVVVTGVSGNLGLRLLPHLSDFSVIGIDMVPPKTEAPIRFVRMDLGLEDSCRSLYNLFKETRPFSVVHLAFVIDPQRTGVLDVDRMWHINVAGTARVMEAITEANRNEDSGIRQFIFPSSVSAYGSDLPGPVMPSRSRRRRSVNGAPASRGWRSTPSLVIPSPTRRRTPTAAGSVEP